MEPELQRVEVEAVRRGDDHLAVDDRTRREPLQQDVVEFGKVSIERTQIPALDVHTIITTENDRAKTVPFRLEHEPVAGWQGFRELGQHRFDWRVDHTTSLIQRRS